MSLPASQQRVLDRIEETLRRREPRLASMFAPPASTFPPLDPLPLALDPLELPDPEDEPPPLDASLEVCAEDPPASSPCPAARAPPVGLEPPQPDAHPRPSASPHARVPCFCSQGATSKRPTILTSPAAKRAPSYPRPQPLTYAASALCVDGVIFRCRSLWRPPAVAITRIARLLPRLRSRRGFVRARPPSLRRP